MLQFFTDAGIGALWTKAELGHDFLLLGKLPRGSISRLGQPPQRTNLL